MDIEQFVVEAPEPLSKEAVWIEVAARLQQRGPLTVSKRMPESLRGGGGALASWRSLCRDGTNRRVEGGEGVKAGAGGASRLRFRRGKGEQGKRQRREASGGAGKTGSRASAGHDNIEDLERFSKTCDNRSSYGERSASSAKRSARRRGVRRHARRPRRSTPAFTR